MKKNTNHEKRKRKRIEGTESGEEEDEYELFPDWVRIEDEEEEESAGEEEEEETEFEEEEEETELEEEEEETDSGEEMVSVMNM